MSRTGDVSVDEHFARIGSKSYAIDKINSIDVRYRYPNGQGTVVVAGALCLFAVGAAIIAPGWWRLALAAGAVALAFATRIAWKQSKIVEYQLFLTTSSHEVAALKSCDRNYVFQLRAKIEAAISNRSTVRT